MFLAIFIAGFGRHRCLRHMVPYPFVPASLPLSAPTSILSPPPLSLPLQCLLALRLYMRA